MIDTPVDTVLFDGVCNLCERWVQFVIRRDRAGRYRFASLQSEVGARLATEHGIDAGGLDSVVLLEGGRAYRRSDAVLRIARRLDGAWPLLSVLRVIPRFIRDAVYDWIGRNRYRWFGRKAVCMVPTPALRARFLDADSSTL